MTPLRVITEDVPVIPDHGRIRTTTAGVCVVWRGEEIYIKSGFQFDGASNPFFLWWWVHPWAWWVILAAGVHDYGYRHHLMTRRECDLLFRALLVHKARQSRWRWLAYRRMLQARIMYRAVRQFGAVAAGADW